MFTNSQLKYLLALNDFYKFGPIRLKKIMNFFSSAEEAFNAGGVALVEAGIEKSVAEEFIYFRANIDPDAIMEKLAAENIKTVVLGEKPYPELLAQIYNPPAVLYYKGSLEAKNKYALGVVGSRKFTSYGQRVAEKIVRDLAGWNVTIASGLAVGIDAIAHTACLENNGITFAILGSGLDRQSIYPSLNRYLAEKIAASGGALISEFSPGTPPLRHHFPQRNRIISGLADGTLVIEAQKKSGALITAECALEQNREVFAVPGNIYSPNSEGTNNLIKKGGRVVTSAEDIIETLDLTRLTNYSNNEIQPETEEEKKILACLQNEPVHINNIIKISGLNAAAAGGTLTLMEIKGLVRNLGGMTYARIV